MKQKITEEMWCYTCEHEWTSEDYYNCHECPKCNQTPIYRQSSFTCFYAMEQKTKEKEMKKRNNSQLAYIDCCMRLTDSTYSFEGMSNDDLDSIYFVAFQRWAYHLTREGYISALNKKRLELSK